MADVNWNLAVTPDPFKQIAEGRDYSRSVFDQAALLKAGSQYAAGDPASAANTVASRGDFKTAGDLSTLATRRQAGQLYAGGDAAGAGKALAGGGDFETAGKLQEQQIKQIEAQQDAMGRTGSFLTAALADPNLAQNPNLPQQAWGLARQQLAAAQIPPERIAEFEKMFAADPKKAAAIMSHIATEVKVTSDGQGTLYLTDKYGNLVNKLGGDSLFPGKDPLSQSLNILNKQGVSGPDLAKVVLSQQTTSFDPASGLFRTTPRYDTSRLQGAGTQQGAPAPNPASGASGTSTALPGGGSVTDTGLRRPRDVPPAIAKLEDDDTNALIAGTTIDQDLKTFEDKIGTGQLPLSMTGNQWSAFKNAVGWSDEGSRNYSDFRAALEDMRNKSLLLAKGVQTEGDAQRAWNALFQSLNDPKAVAQRLGEIRGQNRRNAQLAVQKINLRRQNARLDPYNWAGLEIPESPYAPSPTATGAPPLSLLRENENTTLDNGSGPQTWTLKNGQPVRVK